MCGIVGYIVKNKLYEKEMFSGLLRGMADTLVHRGPDDAGYYETKTQNGEFYVGLAHRRLSIIDLGSGHQPMGNEDDSVQIVFNGEIYNYQELKNKLTESGHKFKTSSDTETIVHAYEEYGQEFVNKLEGMFAFALWDENDDQLVLARDHFGKKPLFIYQTSDLVLFASEIKALLTFKNLKLDINKHAVWQYMQYRYVPGPETLISGIRKLNPGSILTWKRGKITEKRFYYPPDRIRFNKKQKLPDNPVKIFRDKLDQAVKTRMVSDVPYGAFLSGGIDSSAVVCFMSKHSNLPIKTFSVGFSESKYSELKYAKTIAEYFKTDHHELCISGQDIIDELPNMVRFRDGPVSETADIPIFLLAKEASNSVKMVLTGEGSDEILGGYPKHVFERYVKYYQLFPSPLRKLAENAIDLLPYKFRRAKIAILNLGLDNTEERLPRWFGALSDKERLDLASFSLAKNNQIETQFDVEEGLSSLRRILYYDQTSWLPDNLLERGDRMTMAASIEGRMPFMDIKLAEFVSDLPDHYRVNKTVTKWILREAIKGLIPDEIVNRPKVGFRVPVNEWFRTSMREFLVDTLTSSDSFSKSYYKPDKLNKVIDDHLKEKQDNEKLLWSLLNLELWHKHVLSKA